jgi:hypothetical protein
MRIFTRCFSPAAVVDDLGKMIARRNEPKNNVNTAPGHLYLIKEREFIKTNESILKLGKTTDIKRRMPAYPKDSRVMVIFYCDTNIHNVERRLIQLFDSRFVKRMDIGHEYYEGDEQEMVFQFVQTMVHVA